MGLFWNQGYLKCFVLWSLSLAQWYWLQRFQKDRHVSVKIYSLSITEIRQNIQQRYKLFLLRKDNRKTHGAFDVYSLITCGKTQTWQIYLPILTNHAGVPYLRMYLWTQTTSLLCYWTWIFSHFCALAIIATLHGILLRADLMERRHIEDRAILLPAFTSSFWSLRCRARCVCSVHRKCIIIVYWN